MVTRRFRVILVVSFSLVTSSNVSAISPEEKLASLSVSRWGGESGIPEESFTAVLAPGDGYVWLAANQGLVRFDGQRAQVFRLGDRFQPRSAGTCGGNTLNSLILGSDGNIWAAASTGCLFRLQRDHFGGFANFQLSGMEAPSPDRWPVAVRGFHNFPGGNRIEVGHGSGVNALDLHDVLPPGGTENSLLPRPSLEKQHIRAPPGRTLLLTSRAPDGPLWAILSDGQLARAEGGNGQTPGHWVPKGKWASASGAVFLQLLAGRNGAVWIASSLGLSRYKDGAVRTWGAAQGLPNLRLTSLFEDHAACVWIGMPEAVSRLCGDRVESIPVGVQQEEVHSTITEDPQGNIWLGGRWGNLYRISPTIFQKFTPAEGTPSSHFTGVAVDPAGDVWASTRYSGLVRISNGRVAQTVLPAETSEVQTLIAHPNGGVLAAGRNTILRVDSHGARPIRLQGDSTIGTLPAFFWEKQNSLLYSNLAGNFRLRRLERGAVESWTSNRMEGPVRIRQWATDANGRIWAVATNDGLLRLDGDAYQPAPKSRPESARIWFSISVDRQGLLWIGTSDGLEIYSPPEARYLTAKPLLYGDNVFHSTEDRFGNIWCATRHGIVRFSRRQALGIAQAGHASTELLYERFGDSHSLPTTNFGLVTSASGATTSDGRIWFPGLVGLVSVQPADFQRSPRPPAPVLLQLNSDGAPRNLNLPLRIPPGGRTLEFVFQTIRLDPLGGDFCRVMLQGFDPVWQPCSGGNNGQRTKQYTSLPPGEYRYVVQTSSQAGVWNGNELRAEITVVPELHQMFWVRVSTVLAFIAALLYLFGRRQRKLVEKNRWLEEKVDERTATLANATRAAESANRAKTEFLATMSHEVRTPMNGVLGAVQILDATSLDQEQQQLVSVIRQSGEDLVGILDDILSLAKVEAGKMDLEKVAVHLPSLAANLVALFRPKAEAKGVSIQFQLDPNVPEFILSDPQRLRQLLLNLVGNAVKFTDHGQVRLLVTSDRDAKSIHFAVEDSGLGIPSDKMCGLFEPFVQADSSTMRRFGGSGLGLSIVRRFVDAMGGSVEVESELGRGSIFRVTLPLEIAPEGAAVAAAPAIEGLEPKPQTGTTVLLVEDNLVNQMVARKMLEKLGCRVTVAGNGRQALAALREENFNLVMMDCHMPEVDGYQATRELRTWGGDFQHLPVIALTANAMAEDRQACLDAGMNDFLSKPIMLARLATAVARWSPAPPAGTGRNESATPLHRA